MERDVKAVKLLLDFNADFINYVGVPPLYIAAKAGFYEGVKLLRQKGATFDQDGENALLASVESGSRECFAAMIEGQEEIILKKIRSHSLSYYAISMKSNLLPLIATITEKQCQIQRQKGNMDEESQFPPFDLKKNEKKKFNTALALGDQYLPYREINAELKQIKSIFTQINDEYHENEKMKNQQNNDLNSLNDYSDDNNIDATNSKNNSNNNNNISSSKDKKQNQKADSSAFLPQMSLNSESAKESYESANEEQNDAIMQKKLTKKLSKIEEIGVNNKKILKLSQDQLNNQSNPTYQFLPSDDESENQNSIENEFEIEEEEEEVDTPNEEDEEDELGYEIEEEEEEVENELGDHQNVEYEYYSEYENQ